MIVYGKAGCTFCDKAVALLKEYEIGYEYIDLMEDEDALKMIKGSGYRTVPQIFTDNGTHIGGYTELVQYLQTP